MTEVKFVPSRAQADESHHVIHVQLSIDVQLLNRTLLVVVRPTARVIL